MRFKQLVFPVLTGCLFAAALPALSQIQPTYRWPSLPLSIGIGPSGFNPDWGHGMMFGGAFWIDYYPGMLPSRLRGLGIEVEARDISLNRHEDPNQQYPDWSEQANTREDTAGGGAIYTWRHYRKFRPYGKFLYSFGSIDFITGLTHATSTYTHDTRGLMSMGGGLEYKAFGPIWVRGDYEYQAWQTLLGKTLDPQGFTLGVAFDFLHPRAP